MERFQRVAVVQDACRRVSTRLIWRQGRGRAGKHSAGLFPSCLCELNFMLLSHVFAFL